MARILVVEDAESLREILTEVLEMQDYEVTAVETAEEGLECLDLSHFDLILSDLKLPKKSGIEFIVEARKINAYVPILLMTAYGTIDLAVKALKLGAQDFITKPFTPEFLTQIVHRYLSVPSNLNRKPFGHTLVSKNKKMQEILNLGRKLGPLPTPVMILGESGSGKEVLARYIHQMAKNTDAPFVGVNCASIPKNLMESEFFGYEPGAFTGASSEKAGLFEVAHRGTLFLDEVGEMPLSLQVKLLRAIQEGEVRRLGSTKNKSVNVRIISATNRNLEEQISSNEFREDLFYRLGVFVIEIPPLRERADDIVVLSEYFVECFSESLGIEKVSISNEAKSYLQSYDWPGNVRELENVIERALIFSSGQIEKEHVFLGSKEDIRVDQKLNLIEVAESAQRNAETIAILQSLTLNLGNKSKTAKDLGVSYKTLLSKIKQYGLEYSA